VLVFQAILLAHGGLTTLGANIFSMGVAGPMLAFGVFLLMARLDLPRWACVFVAAALADLGTYVMTSLQLALAYPGDGFMQSFQTFLGVFAVTQIPLAIVEGIIFVMFVDYLSQSRPDLLGPLAKLRSKKGAPAEKEIDAV
jgi:cobalt/nickel transport system permease protein